MPIKRVEFYNKGQKLKGVLYLRKKAPLVLMAHGFAGSKDTKLMIFLSKFLYKNGYSALRFDFRGSGESEGEFRNLFEEASDLKKAYSFSRKYSRKIILYGHSLGASVINLSKLKSKAVIFLNPTFSTELVAFSFLRRLLPFFWIHRLFRKIDLFADKRFENLETSGVMTKDAFRFRITEEDFFEESRILKVSLVRNIHSPILFIHGTKDKVMHIAATRHAYLLAHRPKEMVLIKEGDHWLGKFSHKLQAGKKILGFLNENGLKGTA